MEPRKPKNTDEYISAFQPDVEVALKELRETIKIVVPKAEETISYGIPAFKLNGKPLVYFGGFKNHIGLYALPSGNEAFKKELSKYKTGKGSIQFPLNKKIPKDLIIKIVKFRIKEIQTKTKNS